MSRPLDPRLRAAHDLNNVLAAIIARAEAALETGRTGAAVRTELVLCHRRFGGLRVLLYADWARRGSVR